QQVDGSAGAAEEGLCFLERLQHEPYWDEVTPLPAPPADAALACGRCRGHVLLDAEEQLRRPAALLLDWDAVAQYVAPLAHVPPAELRAGGGGRGGGNLSWRFPSWRAPEGPSYETMTLSDGLDSAWRALAQRRQAPGGSSECLRSLRCSTALLVGEAVQLARGALALDAPAEDWEAFVSAWPASMPWRALLERGWGRAVVGALLLLSATAREAPLTNWRAVSAPARAPETQGARGAEPPCSAWDTVLRLLLGAASSGAGALATALAAAPPPGACGGPAAWLRAARPALQFAAAALGEPGVVGPRPAAVGGASYGLCSAEVLRVPLGARGAASLHISRPPSWGRSRSEDVAGRRWLRVEVLLFVSTTDGCVRMTTYGKTADVRQYYSHALTLPEAHLLQWRCVVPAAGSAAPRGYAAHAFSPYGYDSMLYCDVPANGERSDRTSSSFRIPARICRSSNEDRVVYGGVECFAVVSLF
ncbi:unnamed protein product, partial [Prorocentrum cordatum]